jgi:isopentenyl-diphosphate Delta-isomerase
MVEYAGGEHAEAQGADATCAVAPTEWVVRVDGEDRCIGTAEKLRAHREGLLHRAFSVFLFNARGELLLQRRSLAKYHSPGLWTNTCCSHPRPGETVESAAVRRLSEEMGIACRLESAFSFVYRAELGRGLIEHEFDHVLVGRFDGAPHPDPREVMQTRWLARDALRTELVHSPENYTAWFHLAIERVLALRSAV